eukprot:5206467-Amphidinium_carterae.2
MSLIPIHFVEAIPESRTNSLSHVMEASKSDCSTSTSTSSSTPLNFTKPNDRVGKSADAHHAPEQNEIMVLAATRIMRSETDDCNRIYNYSYHNHNDYIVTTITTTCTSIPQSAALSFHDSTTGCVTISSTSPTTSMNALHANNPDSHMKKTSANDLTKQRTAYTVLVDQARNSASPPILEQPAVLTLAGCTATAGIIGLLMLRVQGQPQRGGATRFPTTQQEESQGETRCFFSACG